MDVKIIEKPLFFLSFFNILKGTNQTKWKNLHKSYLDISIQIECEIGIRTLTSHRFFGQIFGLRKDGRRGREYSFAVVLGQKI